MPTTTDAYHQVLDDLLELAKRGPGWNSYDADQAMKDALLGAVGLVNSFHRLSAVVPRPAVGLSPDGAVVLRWLLPEHEVEIEYRGIAVGEYTVTRRTTRDVIAEGQLREFDPLKDVVGRFVAGLPQRSRP